MYKIHLSGKIFQIAVSFDRLSNILIGQHAFRTKRLVKYLVTKETKGRFFFVPISKILVPTAFR
jgi:response regulator RpfG family c-di-GMP phosphodiesterase